MSNLRHFLILGIALLCTTHVTTVHAQFKLSPADSARLAKEAIIHEDSVKRAAEQAKKGPAAKDSLGVKNPGGKADSTAASRTAPPSNARTIERQTAPQAGKNLPRVKDAAPKTR